MKGKEKAPKVKKEKQPKPKKEKLPGRGRTALAVIALVLAVLSLGGGVYYVLSERQAAAVRANALARENSAIDKRVSSLEEAASLEKNREKVVIQMEPHGLAAYMADSAYLYQTLFSDFRLDSGTETGGNVKLRVPVTVTIYNESDQTITIESAALYPWETIFEETARQETLAAQQAKGCYGELVKGQRDAFSIAPGTSATIEVDARLRGVYGHPALEAETRRFFMGYFEDPEHASPSAGDDVTLEGKGIMNGQVNYLFREALAFYCAQRHTRFTLTYTIGTGRGNTFSATCTVPF